MGALQKYAFINAKLRARISKILPEQAIGNLLRAPTLIEAVQLLRGTDYEVLESVYSQTGDLKMAELTLFTREVRLHQELERYVAAEVLVFVRALTARFEAETLKNALRLWFEQQVRRRPVEQRTAYLYREKIHHDLPLDRIVNAGPMEEVIEALEDTPYQEILRREAPKVSSLESLFPVEIALDHAYYRGLLAAVAGLDARDRAIARRVVGVDIDMRNIDWLIRFRSFYNLPLAEALRYVIPEGRHVDGGAIAAAYEGENLGAVVSDLLKAGYPGFSGLASAQSGDSASRLVFMERLLEQIMLREVQRSLAGYPFTIGVILAYTVLKEREISTVTTILNAKFYGWSEERIQEVL